MESAGRTVELLDSMRETWVRAPLWMFFVSGWRRGFKPWEGQGRGFETSEVHAWAWRRGFEPPCGPG